jgi:N-methylhydantoinase A
MSLRLGLDTGGTFTDLIGVGDDGRLVINKVPSTPHHPLEAIDNALRGLEVDRAEIESLRIGTTVATNALLQRRGATVIYLTTAGFEDVPFIQRMNRRYHYSLRWVKPAPLVERRNCVGVAERITYKGEVLTPLSEEALHAAGDAVERRLQEGASGDVALAVCLLFSYLNPAHELRLGEYLAGRFRGIPVSLSHQVAPIWREYERGNTVIADSYIKPTIREYVRAVRDGLRAVGFTGPWALIKSNGGSTTGDMAEAQPIGLLLSGLSGGLISGQYFAALAGAANALTLDMGGTSCDVGLIRDGKISYSTDFQIEWGLPVSVPSVDISTLGAGGGSIGWIDKGGLLRVGPRSAGAEPGPACYGRGGTEATVTDANLVLGRLNPAYFLGGRLALNVELARASVGELGSRLGLGEAEAAQAIVDIADENMANALRVLSINRGLDPRDFTLIAFGGAGPLHGASIARALGMKQVVIPIYPGLCSAFGTLLADLQVNRVLSTNFRSDAVTPAMLEERFARLAEAALEELRQEGYTGQPDVERSISMRYWGQNYEHDVKVPAGPIDEAALKGILAEFNRVHEQFYGYSISGEVIELIRFNVTAYGHVARPSLTVPLAGGPKGVDRAAPSGQRAVYFAGHGFVETPVYGRDALPAGCLLDGPAVVESVDSTVLVHPGQELSLAESGILRIALGGPGEGDRAPDRQSKEGR